MSARNKYHDAVRAALIADGWTITHDPLTVSFAGRDLYVDLGAEAAPIAAERAGRKIAVEIQSFVQRSTVRDIEESVGQYMIYKIMLAHNEPDRDLFMAIPKRTYESVFTEKFGSYVAAQLKLRMLVFDERKESVDAWIE